MQQPELLSPTALAYLGDAVYHLFVRQRLLAAGQARMPALHRAATRYVRAGAQAEALQELLPELAPDEADVVRRARNQRPARVPRGADQSEYRLSTAFEALLGYLYLKPDQERLQRFLLAAARRVEAMAGSQGR